MSQESRNSYDKENNFYRVMNYSSNQIIKIYVDSSEIKNFEQLKRKYSNIEFLE